MTIPQSVKLVEVGPRDGLQNESAAVSTADKINLIHGLIGAGVSYIEAGSFVNPRSVPQMADSDQVFAGLRSTDAITLAALTPNLKGFERAMESGIKEVAVFASASEGFSQKNINCTIAESLTRFEPLMQAARDQGVAVRGYISCVVGCPYDGMVTPQQVDLVSRALFDMGCYEVSLGDTIGVGTAGHFKRLLDHLLLRTSADKLALHCHDTYGQALANICASLEYGIATVDASVAGLGGCPYALNATGNVASEDVVYMLKGMGISTGIDLDKLIEVGQSISSLLGKPTNSHVARARSNAA
ncbi:hydroxymethylglutaryl-CoA lyase [SAR92 clade bacterium H455]|uniref:hydroxymethylglutaryl-CoA lyase n=1 Tax=SAR92 clade bacterium H455 TaxID=2974818 RepID=A0ABY5TQ41_9GAMM|nr:hydroxymethylglutaryl-CoA lyase [SAR92 clade bacterium H455]